MPGSRVPNDKAPVQLDKFVRMEANLCSREEKMRVLFGLDVNTASERELNTADVKMCRWRKHPLYDQIWKDELGKQDYEDYSRARQVLRDGMKEKDDKWLALNSAINVISNGNKRIFRDDQMTINVQIEGMPDIGEPDD